MTENVWHDKNCASARTSCLVLGKGPHIVLEEVANRNELVEFSIMQEILQRVLRGVLFRHALQRPRKASLRKDLAASAADRR